jgi:hypothetical protein
MKGKNKEKIGVRLIKMLEEIKLRSVVDGVQYFF